MAREVSLKRFSDKTLIKLFFRQLYYMYDLDGISCGRSHRSGLLERAQFLMGDSRGNWARWSCKELLKEAERRISGRKIKKTKLHKKLKSVKNYSLAYLLIYKLFRWVIKDNKEKPTSFIEKEMIKAILQLMRINGFGVSEIFYARELRKEADNRKWKIRKMQETKRFRKLNLI